MPADRSITEVRYNVHSHSTCRDASGQPYPLPRTVYIQSSTHDPANSFEHLCLNDHIVAAQRVTCHKLERLETSRYLRGLIKVGASETWDLECPYNGVLQVAAGYTSACTTGILDELATVNDEFISFRDQSSRRLDVADVEIEELKRDSRVARDVRITTSNRVIGLQGMVTDMSASLGILSIEMETARISSRVTENLIVLGSINNRQLDRIEARLWSIEERLTNLLVAFRHGAQNPIVVDEVEEETVVGEENVIPLMVRVEREDTVIPPSRSPSPL
jgi:hypothetical protein